MRHSNFLKGLWAVASFLLISVSGHAQFLRTSYFLDGSHFRQQLNPALAPERGYINFPVIGSFNATVNSSSFGLQDVIDIIDNSSQSDYFMSSDFINRLDASNRLNVNISTDILSAGWYKGQNFWSFNVGLRNDIGASIPRSMFELLNEMNGMDVNTIDWSNYNRNVGEESLNINSYVESQYAHWVVDGGVEEEWCSDGPADPHPAQGTPPQP